ncbi:hypothetical protein ACTMU2_40255 [Cupriavidus basilensis]
MGLNGAFLAGDLFNLFVFFEILLIASYALPIHGAGRERIGAGLHSWLLNLVGLVVFPGSHRHAVWADRNTQYGAYGPRVCRACPVPTCRWPWRLASC